MRSTARSRASSEDTGKRTAKFGLPDADENNLLLVYAANRAPDSFGGIARYQKQVL
jgi:hypothetical protein